MSKIEEMIKRLCPNGVERVPVWRYTAWDKKFNAVDKSMQESINKYKYLLAKDLEGIKDNSGDIRILYTTEEIAYTTEEKAGNYISEGEVIAIPWGGTPSVKYYKGRFITGDNRIATSTDAEKLSNKYLYYVLLDNMKTISKFYRGAGIKHPSMYSILTLEIPLPPLTIQREIVSVLDFFTTLIDKMKQEVELRKKQMEYYSRFLIKQIITDKVSISSFTKVLRGRRLTKNMLSEDYTYPVFHGGNEPIGFYKEANRDANSVMIINVGASAGTVGFCNSNFWSSDGCFCLQKNKDVLDKYVYYALKNKEKQIMSMVRNAGIPTLDASAVEKVEIPLPPLSTQRSIVSTLDTFEQYISKLERLITLHEKQYAYYREKLLTFE